MKLLITCHINIKLSESIKYYCLHMFYRKTKGFFMHSNIILCYYLYLRTCLAHLMPTTRRHRNADAKLARTLIELTVAISATIMTQI